MTDTLSKEFWEGYNTKSSRTRNPYAVGQPWLAEFPDKKLIKQCNDWFKGWDTQFFGEDP